MDDALPRHRRILGGPRQDRARLAGEIAREQETTAREAGRRKAVSAR